jgi:regulator of sigma E protease
MVQPSLLLTIVAFILLLGPLVTVHELGHYLVGRWCGVHAEAFSIGFGRELVGWTDKRGTRWKLSLLPLGGYVQFAGDMNAASMPLDSIPLSRQERERSFHYKPLWQRAAVVAAGPATNFVVAVAVFAAFNMAYDRIAADAVVGKFVPNSPAQAAGMQVGDKIVSIDGAAISDFAQIGQHVMLFPGESVEIAIERNGAAQKISVRLADVAKRDSFGNIAHVGQLGVGADLTKVHRVRLGPVQAIGAAFQQCFDVMGSMVTAIQQIVVGKRSVGELGGPIKIAQISGQQLSLGWKPFVYLAGFISINLAFINLLPIPGVDGGHLAMYAAEAVRRRPLDGRSQEWAMRVGLAFVLALMLFSTINDVVSLNLLGR